MKCGLGKCGRCNIGDKYVCKDGPVFRFDQLDELPNEYYRRTGMENMVTVFLFGKKYEVPDSLTIMEAMEYSGYQLVRGCGCRNGFCGACATSFRSACDS